ncbi:GntR family transcriptional regulator [Tsukamurella soli]|uniref:GntR family transcriptional regulator n=1 Tax=Tsukamurella soli TaxID=644556 RepID=A0ABP8JGA8_9ACTN
MSSESERVYDEIWAMVRDGRFAQGAPLREAHLAETIGVSRTPVREALRRLAAEGIVEIRPNKGAQLIAFDDADTATIFDVRALLEPYTAGLAATRADPEAIARLHELITEMDAVTELGPEHLDELATLNGEFHRVIIDSARARLAREAISVVLRTPLISRTFHSYDAHQLARSQQHHREIVAAIEAHDPQWAQSIMRAHIEAGRSIYFSHNAGPAGWTGPRSTTSRPR